MERNELLFLIIGEVLLSKGRVGVVCISRCVGVYVFPGGVYRCREVCVFVVQSGGRERETTGMVNE